MKLQIGWSRMPPVNTGALCQLMVRRPGVCVCLDVQEVEVSAASHASPAYHLSAEAPRVYGEVTKPEYRRAWLRWIANRLGTGDCVTGAYRGLRSMESQYLKWIDYALTCEQVCPDCGRVYYDGCVPCPACIGQLIPEGADD